MNNELVQPGRLVNSDPVVVVSWWQLKFFAELSGWIKNAQSDRILEIIRELNIDLSSGGVRKNLYLPRFGDPDMDQMGNIFSSGSRYLF